MEKGIRLIWWFVNEAWCAWLVSLQKGLFPRFQDHAHTKNVKGGLRIFNFENSFPPFPFGEGEGDGAELSNREDKREKKSGFKIGISLNGGYS